MKVNSETRSSKLSKIWHWNLKIFFGHLLAVDLWLFLWQMDGNTIHLLHRGRKGTKVEPICNNPF